MPMVQADGSLTPTLIIKPPISKPIIVPSTPEQRAQEVAILELERKLVEQQVRRQIAEAHQNGTTQKLKQLIVMNGPVDFSVSRAPKPPEHGAQKVALVGINDKDVAQSVESFFGAPMTPESEQAILETVKQQLATGKPGEKPMQVRVAGWWPAEGVMAVSVVSGS